MIISSATISQNLSGKKSAAGSRRCRAIPGAAHHYGRGREIRAFVAQETYCIITAAGMMHRGKLQSYSPARRAARKTESDQIVWKGNGPSRIFDTSEQKRSRDRPFITSTLPSKPQARVGLSPSRTMSLAQKLYEAGHSPTYAPTAPRSRLTRQGDFLICVENCGAPYAEMRAYKSKVRTRRKRTSGAPDERCKDKRGRQ